jgi:hypothetical protein
MTQMCRLRFYNVNVDNIIDTRLLDASGLDIVDYNMNVNVQSNANEACSALLLAAKSVGKQYCNQSPAASGRLYIRHVRTCQR